MYIAREIIKIFYSIANQKTLIGPTNLQNQLTLE